MPTTTLPNTTSHQPVQMVEVTCQVRFPAILRIDTEPPAQFQERLRGEYPIYQQTQPVAFQIAFPGKVPSAVPGLTSGGSHQFASRDQTHILLLTRDFLALTCGQYSGWESFRGRMASVLAVLAEVYAPPFFSRVGLRFQRFLRRSALGMDATPWSELLATWTAGLLGAPELAAQAEHVASLAVLRFPDGHVNLQHGTVLTGMPSHPPDELSYLIDTDHYNEQQTELQDVLARLDVFDREARNIFHACTTERLRDALRRQTLEAGVG